MDYRTEGDPSAGHVLERALCRAHFRLSCWRGRYFDATFKLSHRRLDRASVQRGVRVPTQALQKLSILKDPNDEPILGRSQRPIPVQVHDSQVTEQTVTTPRSPLAAH